MKVNDVELPYLMETSTPEQDEYTFDWADGDVMQSGPFTTVFSYAEDNGGAVIGAFVPCDWTGEVKVYVTKK